MNNSKAKGLFTALAALTVLSACETAQVEKRELLTLDIPHPHKGDAGVVILEGMSVGNTSAYTAAHDDSDCLEGSGMGVKVQSSTGDKRFLFDANGRPCEASKTLYDGQLPVHRRAADPSINISFVDKFGDRPSELIDIVPSLAQEDEFAGYVDMAEGTSPEDFALLGKGVNLAEAKKPIVHSEALLKSKGGDHFSAKLAAVTNKNVSVNDWAYQKEKTVSDIQHNEHAELSQTIQSWHQEDQRKKLVKQAEKVLAGARSLERKTSHELIEEQQMELERVVARLRESEKMAEQQRYRERVLQDQLLAMQAQMQALEASNMQTEKELEQRAQVTAERAQEYKHMLTKMQREKQGSEDILRQRISLLRKQLKSAEESAEAGHQKLLLDAAEQLALAEAKTRQANKQKREKYQRLAEQKRLEASFLDEKVSTIPEHYEVALPEFTDIAFMENPNSKLEDRIVKLENRMLALQVPSAKEKHDTSIAERSFVGTQVEIKAEDQTLDSIMRSALSQAMPTAQWELEWKLSDVNASIKNEKWTVVAEARMDELLAYVKQKVKQAHGAQLEFHRFESGGLFIISDTPVVNN